MKRIFVFFFALIISLGISVQSQATLTIIGTATYGGDGSTDNYLLNGSTENFNLIYDDNSPFGSIVWLDYTRGYNSTGGIGDTLGNQVNWASGLNASGVLTYNFNPGVTVTWTDVWRLPLTVDAEIVADTDPSYYDGTGPNCYNITTSEMGHLYYSAVPDGLGNLGDFATDGTPQAGSGLNNTGDFQNLYPFDYWSGTGYDDIPEVAWGFDFSGGRQQIYDVNQVNESTNGLLGIAVRPANIATAPEPSTFLLLCTGIIGLVAVYFMTKKMRTSV